ncbi:hypothetical protein J6590_022456 [Homalodisca vitripennis]|nr:hypothetical protein J6590_022456 [Homalodisca vitripennis]
MEELEVVTNKNDCTWSALPSTGCTFLNSLEEFEGPLQICFEGIQEGKNEEIIERSSNECKAAWTIINRVAEKTSSTSTKPNIQPDELNSFVKPQWKKLVLKLMLLPVRQSTVQAIDTLVEQILLTLEDSTAAQVTLCDLSKAFDTVQHDVLLAKLQFSGYKPSCLGILPQRS